MKHTPAPWAAFADTDPLHEDGVICATGNGNEIRPSAGQKLGDEAADLALIACAPELLDALKHALRWHDQLNSSDIKTMQALIARATGETT
jgi:hypothetical protein